MMESDMDLVLAIHQVKSMLFFAVKYGYMYGHQDQKRKDTGENNHARKDKEAGIG